MKEIAFTKVKLPYGWMSNMSPHPIEHNGKKWRTAEALFQALRFCDSEIQERIRAETSPIGCKLRVKAIVKDLTVRGELHKRCIEPMSEPDLKNMELCLRLKLKQHPKLVTDLLATRDSPIYEDVTSRGARGTNLFWGAMRNPNGAWTGRNELGKMWERLRTEFL
jgi:predicted NAD-dependent protein-ADP-ribosyltransferase YbiA (DUF1768 family)